MTKNDPIELAAIDRGAGSTVALVHGGVFHSGPAWAKSISPLVDAGFRAIAVDRRGHGRSDPGGSDDIPVHLHADDLRLTLELRDADPSHLVGVSYGALVCLEYALSWPDRVVSLVLVEPPLFTWLADDPDYAVWYESFLKIEERATKTSEDLADWVTDWLSLIDPNMARDVKPGSQYWPIIEKQAPLIFKEEAGWHYQPSDDAVHTLTVPVLVMNGDQSEPPMQVIGTRLAEA
ncbi:MAG: alpha/beta hydrolase, partial [Actinobacteria bacterium]|nr:alpha/beta hydrolase [Actinomycetota bacterium]